MKRVHELRELVSFGSGLTGFDGSLTYICIGEVASGSYHERSSNAERHRVAPFRSPLATTVVDKIRYRDQR